MIGMVVLLTIFLFLVMSGISESAIVAVVIFFIHLIAMVMLIASGAWYVYKYGPHIASLNFDVPLKNGFFMALFLGFSTAMLGISGFESSANFVEEQQPGVFRKTLRNMWVAVSVINPLMALTAVMVLPISEINAHQEALLSDMGLHTGGWLATLFRWMRYWC